MAFAAPGDHRRAWDLTTLINPATPPPPRRSPPNKVEPYAMAADVYAVAPHTGRGGWSWYTGSAGWMYRLLLESLLGRRLEVDRLYIEPCLPEHWSGFKVHYRFRETVYHIGVTRVQEGVNRVTVDGVVQEGSGLGWWMIGGSMRSMPLT